MAFEAFRSSKPPKSERNPDEVVLSKTEVRRGLAEKQIAQAKSFEDLNIALRDLGNIPIEGSSEVEFSGQELQARITDLRDALAEAKTPEDIDKITGDLAGITRGLGLRDKVTELITPELNKKKAEIIGEAIG